MTVSGRTDKVRQVAITPLGFDLDVLRERTETRPQNDRRAGVFGPTGADHGGSLGNSGGELVRRQIHCVRSRPPWPLCRCQSCSIW